MSATRNAGPSSSNACRRCRWLPAGRLHIDTECVARKQALPVYRRRRTLAAAGDGGVRDDRLPLGTQLIRYTASGTSEMHTSHRHRAPVLQAVPEQRQTQEELAHTRRNAVVRTVRVLSGPVAASVISPCLPGARSAWITTLVACGATSIHPSTCRYENSNSVAPVAARTSRSPVAFTCAPVKLAVSISSWGIGARVAC